MVFDSTSSSVLKFTKKLSATPGTINKVKLAWTALKGVMITHPIIAVVAALSLVGTALYKLHDRLTVTSEEVQDSYDKYKNLESELKEIGNELENNNKKIDELQSKDSLTYIEKSQLNDLKEATEHLLIQQDIKERELANSRKEAANTAVDHFKQEYGNESNNVINNKIQYNTQLDKPHVTRDESISGNIANFVWLKDEIVDVQSELKNTDSLTEESISRLSEYYQQLDNKLRDTESNIDFIIGDLEDARQSIETEYNHIMSLGKGAVLTNDQKDIINSYDQILSLIQLIYSYYDPNKWNHIQIESIFKTENIEKTKEELIEMAEDGILTPDTIRSYENLNGALENSNLLLDDTQDAASLLCDEIYASVDAAKELDDDLDGIQLNDIFALKTGSGNLTKLGEYSEQLDEIQSAYNTLTEAMDRYERTGSITIDQFQEIISHGSKFLDYLDLEDGQLDLNEQAMYDLAEARIVEMKAQIMQGIVDNVNNIKNETDVAKYLTSTNYDLAESYQTLYKEEIRAWAAEKLKAGWDYDNVFSVLQKATKDIDKISALNIDTGTLLDGADDAWKDLLDKELALLDAQQEAGTISFQQYIDNRKSILKKYYDEAKITAAEYYSYLKETYEKQQNIYDKILNAAIRRFDKEIEKIDDEIESIEKQNEALEKQLEQYDLLLSAVTYIFDEERDALEAEIESIDLKIENMQKANDELEKQIAYEQALDELYRARTQRTRYLYAGEGRGFIYTQDQEAIREAEDKLSDLAFEKTIDNLEKEKDKIQDIIDKLNEVEEAWGKIGEAYDKNKAVSTAESILGKDYKDIILEGDPTVIQNFTNAYVSAQQKIDDNNSMIESWEEKKLVYEEMKSKWQEISDAYENSIEDQLAAQQWGADWENALLADRGAMMEDFKNTYTANLQEIARIAEETAQREYDAALKAEVARDKRNEIDNEENNPSSKNVSVNATKPGKPQNRVYQKYHTGLEKGLVGKNSTPLSDEQRFKLLQRVARTDLKPDEIPAILQKGEAVMTPEQIRNVTDNLISASYGKILTIPNLPSSKQDVNITQHITITLPNVTNEGGYNKVVKEIQALQLVAYQNSFKR